MLKDCAILRIVADVARDLSRLRSLPAMLAQCGMAKYDVTFRVRRGSVEIEHDGELTRRALVACLSIGVTDNGLFRTMNSDV